MTLTALLHRAMAAGPAAADAVEERILDAALAGAATMDDVARRAGVGRMTVFRRFGSKEALLERLAVRELQRFLGEVDQALATIDDPGERVAEAFVACLRAARTHPVFARASAADMFVLLGRGTPSPLELGRRFVAARLEEDGDVDDPEAVADVLVRLAASYALQPADSGETLRDEAAARAFALRVLAPIATGRA